MWGGVDQADTWRKKRRDIRMWMHDPDVDKKKLGPRLFRACMGRAAELVKALDDETMTSEDGAQQILKYFDKLYSSVMAIQKDEDFDRALYNDFRMNDEDPVAFVTRKQIEFKRYELSAGASLPVGAKGKVFMRQARLSREQSSKVSTCSAGVRDDDAVVKALLRLDTDVDAIAMLTGQSVGSKNLWVGESDMRHIGGDYDKMYHFPAEVPQQYFEELAYADQEELNLYAEEHDIGPDIDEEDQVCIEPEDLRQQFDEEALQSNFSQFEK